MAFLLLSQNKFGSQYHSEIAIGRDRDTISPVRTTPSDGDVRNPSSLIAAFFILNLKKQFSSSRS